MTEEIKRNTEETEPKEDVNHIAECHNCGHISTGDFNYLLEEGCTLCKSYDIVFVGVEK